MRTDMESALAEGCVNASALHRDEILHLLREHKAVLCKRFDVATLSLFGSVARGDAASGSDIDVLVQFNGPATSKRFFGLQFYLEDLTGRSIDLVTNKALRLELRPYVDRDRVDV